MSVFNVYDAAAAFPQPALLGRGSVDRNGNHTPPPGLAGHDVTNDLPHGIDEAFYTTTAADVLTPKSQNDVDAIIAQREADKAAETAAQKSRQEWARDEHSQGNSIPDLVARVDNLVEILQDRGVIPR